MYIFLIRSPNNDADIRHMLPQFKPLTNTSKINANNQFEDVTD